MTIARKIHNDGAYLVCRIIDEVTAEEIIDLLFWIMNQFQHDVLKINYRILLDVKAVNHFHMNESDIHRISQINVTYRQKRGQIKTAIVVASESGRQLAELHKTLSAAVDIVVEIFESEQMACDWLGIDMQTISGN